MHRMIITADDYGMSKAVNKAIDEGIDAGVITSTNVMTNMPYYQEAQKHMGNTTVSVGIHWVLTCGKPILHQDQIPSIVDDNGCFLNAVNLKKRLRQHTAATKEIKDELIAQFRVFQQKLGVPEYWNTHENIHLDFLMYPIFINVAKELGIMKMRNCSHVYVSPQKRDALLPVKWRAIEPVKRLFLETRETWAKHKGFESPNGQVLCLNKNDVYDLEHAFSNIMWGKKQIVEYVIHPATQNDSPFFGNLIEKRLKEYELFRTSKVINIIQKQGIDLCSFSFVDAGGKK